MFVLPGDQLEPTEVLADFKSPLKLGPGLRHVPPTVIISTTGGQICSDAKKNAVWAEYNGGRVSTKDRLDVMSLTRASMFLLLAIL